MICPIKVLDFDLAHRDTGDVPVSDRYRQARILVRWTSRPIGTVLIPAHAGCIRRTDILSAVLERLDGSVGAEFVRHALLTCGQPGALHLDHRPARQLRAPHLPTLSVIICTRDRPDDLAICLTAIAALDPTSFETIVVDNAPATEASAELLRHRFPQFRYVREDRPGLDHARNRGIREASGQIIAFTDDDVVVDPTWAGALVDAFAEDDAVGLVTGLVEPFELETEAQILFENYGGFGRGYRRRYLQAPTHGSLPWHLIGAGQLGAGASMAVRKCVFEEIGLFDPALDVGTGTLGGGDHELFFRVIKSGWLSIYEPAALARHRHRRTRRELRRLTYTYGYGTRAFFERVGRNFPEDSAALRRLKRWWWREWALKRWWRGWSRPTLLPTKFVVAEIKGYLHGRGAYTRVRRQLVADEKSRPDLYSVKRMRRAQLASLGTVFIEVARPLEDLRTGVGSRVVTLVIQRDGEPLGSFRLATDGRPVSASRLADEIASRFHLRLLRSSEKSATATGSFHAELRSALGVIPPVREPLPDEVSATIVVATCDRPVELRRCLISLTALRTSRSVQIVVVDNRPGSGRSSAVVAEFPGVELVNEFRPGSAFARNAGIAAACGEIVAMTDDDMVVSPEWLERLLEPFARADVMAVTGNTMPARTETEAERWFEIYGGFCRGFESIDYGPLWFHRFGRRVVPTWKIGGSGNAAFRREIFSRTDIGPFDPRLGAGMPTGVGEDTYLFYVILHAGFTIAYRPAALAWHHHRVTMPQLRAQIYAYSKGHVGYHLLTLLNHRDTRALAWILLTLPANLIRRMWKRARGSSSYPCQLLFAEAVGMIMGPWALWSSHRLVSRIRKTTHTGEPHSAPAAAAVPASASQIEAAS